MRFIHKNQMAAAEPGTILAMLGAEMLKLEKYRAEGSINWFS